MGMNMPSMEHPHPHHPPHHEHGGPGRGHQHGPGGPHPMVDHHPHPHPHHPPHHEHSGPGRGGPGRGHQEHGPPHAGRGRGGGPVRTTTTHNTYFCWCVCYFITYYLSLPYTFSLHVDFLYSQMH